MAFGSGADTIGVFFEGPAESKCTATVGWYNMATFESEATKAGLYSMSINGDAFSNSIKEQTIELIKKRLGKGWSYYIQHCFSKENSPTNR